MPETDVYFNIHTRISQRADKRGQRKGKIYKDKKLKGCALCKPHKHGWAPKKKAKVLAFERETDKEIMEALGKQG